MKNQDEKGREEKIFSKDVFSEERRPFLKQA
jgi:hypothetical protein